MVMKFKDFLDEDKKEWVNWVNDNYATLDIDRKTLERLLSEFIYKLPKRYSNKKYILDSLRKDGIRVSPKEFNSYIDGFDESRLEELVGLVQDAVRKWGGVG